MSGLDTKAAALVLAALLLLGVWGTWYFLADPALFRDGLANLQRFLIRVGSLSFPPLGKLIALTGMTLGIVVLGTLLAALLSVPVAWASAAVTAPNGWIRSAGRFLGVLSRAVPDVVLAMVFATIFALGAIPGILAFGLHSIGMISRLFADAIEQSEAGPRLAIRAAGGTKWQEFTSGILPQVFPSWVATVLHRADINLRGSIIMGYAGVAGLGLEMRNAFAIMDYSLGLGIAVVMLVLCVGMEVVSSTARHRLLGLGNARRRSARRANRPPYLMAASVTALIAASIWVCQIGWSDLAISWEYLEKTARSFWPPSTGSYGMSRFLGAMGVTVSVAISAVLVSLVGSLLLGSFAARNVAPNRGVRSISRLLLIVIRAIPELVLAIVLIVVFGLGAPAGVLALGVCGVGLLGKLIADSIEENPPGPEIAVSATGATRLQRYTAATLPGVRRAIIGHVFYLLDTNIRAATILGVVGGGGIGYYLLTASQGSRYGQVTLIVAMIVAVVMVVEALAMWVRKVLR
ncbi:MAG: ABC transporter permease subunit [Propionibacteriaceae bacterium]|jgi:phosphonate transport system permease protein|nr:ABC transporter permease subunit [Propionibacteriaceae bacterium]